MNQNNGNHRLTTVDFIEEEDRAPEQMASTFYDSNNPELKPAKQVAVKKKGWKRKLVGWCLVLLLIFGGAVALYSWITALLGSPLNNGQKMINVGLAAFIVGVCLLGIYLLAALRERLFSRQGKIPTSTEPSAPIG